MHSTTIITFVLSLYFLAVVHSVDFSSNRQLGSMLYYLSGQSPHDFADYGCWCSNKDRPTHAPLDEIDQCCHTYQSCDPGAKGSDVSHAYKSAFEDGTIECANNEQTKAHRQCQCDLELARCLNEHQAVYTTNLLYPSDAKCSPGMVLNFDDLLTNTTFKTISGNYHNFTFTGASYTTGKDAKDPSRVTGYTVAMVSPPNVAFSQNQMTIKRTDGQPFSVVSFSAASVYVKNLKLTLVGSRQHSPVVFNETVFLQYDTRSTVELNWSSIDMLTLNGTGGKSTPGFSGTCGDCHFALDDLRFRL